MLFVSDLSKRAMPGCDSSFSAQSLYMFLCKTVHTGYEWNGLDLFFTIDACLHYDVTMALNIDRFYMKNFLICKK